MLWLQNSAHIWSLSPNMHNVNILEVGLVPKAKSTGQCNYFNPIHDWFHETVHFQTTFLHSYFFHMKSSALPFLNFLFWANFKLQKSYKNSIEFSCILHQLLLMLTFQVTMVQWAKLDLTRHLPYWSVPGFSTDVPFFCSRPSPGSSVGDPCVAVS